MATLYQYAAPMARVWLVLALAFALATGGVANAAVANCPMQEQAAVAVSVHACCPDDGKAAHGHKQKQTSDGCVFGMACWSSAVAPTTALMALPSAVVLITEQRLGEAAPPSGPLQQLFRPPRSI